VYRRSGDYLKGIGAPSEATNQTIADLVAALVELYRNDQACVVDGDRAADRH
jgi:anti-sigma regulatory factor (Ser/Thr protein kinase)